MNKNNALVAVSTGLLQAMTKPKTEAVLGHEISHVANGDMVTLALIQGARRAITSCSTPIFGNLAVH